jgi:hypothetical protein
MPRKYDHDNKSSASALRARRAIRVPSIRGHPEFARFKQRCAWADVQLAYVFRFHKRSRRLRPPANVLTAPG